MAASKPLEGSGTYVNWVVVHTAIDDGFTSNVGWM